MASLKDQLLIVASGFAAAKRLSESRVSTVVFGDGKVLNRLRDGADLTTTRFELAMTWFATNWPADAAWPEGVDRPEVVAQ